LPQKRCFSSIWAAVRHENDGKGSRGQQQHAEALANIFEKVENDWLTILWSTNARSVSILYDKSVIPHPGAFSGTVPARSLVEAFAQCRVVMPVSK